MKIAFAGLGVMGAPMARHLVEAGHQVAGYNRSAAKAQAWAEGTGGRLLKTSLSHEDEAKLQAVLDVAAPEAITTPNLEKSA